MTEKKASLSDFAAEIEQLKAARKLPTLDELLDAVAEARQKFARKILEARETNLASVRSAQSPNSHQIEDERRRPSDSIQGQTATIETKALTRRS